MEKEKIAELTEAIRRFNITSTDLEKSYRLLEEQVRHLKGELSVKNRALQESTMAQDRLREQAERNKRLAAVGEMSARIAHELRNPLGSIELFASLLKKSLPEEPEKQSWAEHIQTAVSAMDYALTNMLFFTGKLNPHFQKTDLKRVIEEAALFSSHLLQQKEIALVLSLDSLTEPIFCDEDLLRQIFVNLILNAIDALPKGGRLAINGVKEEGQVRIMVSDTGCGIPEDQVSKIFDPFFTTKNKGTGLGLAIVYNAIVAHHGTIEVKSKVHEENAPCGGTVFTVTLPANGERAVE